MSNVIFIIKLKVKAEFFDEVYTFSKAIHKLTHEFDEGVIQYDLYKVKEEENTLCFFENWENTDLYERHRNKEHTKNFKEFLDGKLENVEKIFLDKYIEELF